MKRMMTMGLAAVFCLTLFSGMAFAGKYKPGTYTGTAMGYSKKNHPGKIDVKVTVDADTIKSIEVVTFEQTTKGKQGETTAKAKEEIPAKIVSGQTLNVDSVTKASMSSNGIKLAVAEALEKATVAYKDGVYTGAAKGYDKKKHPGKIEVKVTIAGGKIATIDITKFDQTHKGKQGELTEAAKTTVPAAIIAKQSIIVDTVTKASMSSNGIKLAVARALEKAR